MLPSNGILNWIPWRYANEEKDIVLTLREFTI
jgi:hypothetical protein